METATSTIVLASGSPRRRELLLQLGIEPSVMPPEVDETVREGERALAYTQRLAEKKARATANKVSPDRIVIAADTVVVLDEEILGKPADAAHARTVLQSLSGQQHRVITSFVVMRGDTLAAKSCQTDVWVLPLDEGLVDNYVACGEGLDKAGAYAIQGRGAAFVERIEGSYSNVVGLPLCELAVTLRDFGLTVPIGK
ncbi:MAG: Maf family protein [Pseudomonadota bacterium]